jgi:hypothetical protein
VNIVAMAVAEMASKPTAISIALDENGNIVGLC